MWMELRGGVAFGVFNLETSGVTPLASITRKRELSHFESETEAYLFQALVRSGNKELDHG
jgi:hypothetical protein